MLRSVQLGLRVTADIALRGGHLTRTLLTLEPESAGDLRLDEECATVIEQVKKRAAHRRWSSGEVGRQVLPDLLRGVSEGVPQRFRFVTDNAAGLEHLRSFLEMRSGGAAAELRWATSRVDAAEYERRLSAAAGRCPEDPTWRKLLDGLEIVVLDPADAEAEIETLLGPMLSPGQNASGKRHEITSRLLDAARAGRMIGAGDLLALVGPDALLRLRHVRSLPALLARRTRVDCRALGYDPALQARLAPPQTIAWLTVLSGESGQGKTWSLCQAALAAGECGANAILIRAPGDLAGLVREVNERVWLPAYEQPTPIPIMARRLAEGAADGDGAWLTIHLDDLQSRPLAEDIARTDWRGLGIRLVISAQPRIAAVLAAVAGSAIAPVRNFTSGELRRFLASHGRDAPLETMPDDVFELLLKPIHAAMFTLLPRRSNWAGATEYELFETYWRHASGHARAQRDHPGDAERLAALAGTLLGPAPRYPWRPRDLLEAGIDDDALLRLEAVGLLTRPATDEIRFGADRMLNWAVAEHLVATAADERWSAEETLRRLEAAHPTHTEAFVQPLTRLGYVLMDALWLLLVKTPPAFVADLLAANARSDAFRWRGEAAWARDVGTLGGRVLPTLEILATSGAVDEHVAEVIGRVVPVAIAGAAQSDPEAAAATIARLLSADGEAATDIALRTARDVSAPGSADAIWRVHQERQREFEAIGRDEEQLDKRGGLLRRRELSGDALRSSIAGRPDWLDARLAFGGDAVALGQLAWFLSNERVVPHSNALELWTRHRAQLLAALPADHGALLEAIRRFGGAEDRERLDAAPLTRADWTGDRVLRSRARIDPDAAFEQIARRADEHGWSAADWWMGDLARIDARRMATAIRANAARTGDSATEVALFYRHRPELLDENTVDWLLDSFATSLAKFNREADAGPEPELGRLAHLLRLVVSLANPAHFDRVAARADTPLEAELARLAVRRSGRTSRVRDGDGEDLELLLAVMAGDGHTALVTAELRRGDPFGREDGYRAAHWSEGTRTREALAATTDDGEHDAYRTVLRLQALAIHGLDNEIEGMLRTGAPVYVNATKMRSSEGRSTDSLRERVESLIAVGDPGEIAVAANLAGFLRKASESVALLRPMLDPATPRATRKSILGTFRALRAFHPVALPIMAAMMDDGTEDERRFVAAYLADQGDADARRAVLDWISAQDVGGLGSLRLEACVDPLLEHGDSRAAMLALLGRTPHTVPHVAGSRHLRALAAHGDELARKELVAAAYRDPGHPRVLTVAGLLHLQDTDPDEAYFACSRLLVRHDSPDAMALMLRISPDRAVPDLLRRYRDGSSELRLAIARQLRLELERPRLAAALDALAESEDPTDREVAAGIAGLMPPNLPCLWLVAFADADATSLRDAAQASIRSRERETAAMAHMAAMADSPKPRQWARLHAIADCVDPTFLWSRDDPASIGPTLDELPHEFRVEAERLVAKRRKTLDDDVKWADRKR